jgi:hypothetical protein
MKALKNSSHSLTKKSLFDIIKKDLHDLTYFINAVANSR